MRRRSLWISGLFLLTLGVHNPVAATVQVDPESAGAKKPYEAVSLFGEKLVSTAPSQESVAHLVEVEREHSAAPTEASYVKLGRALVSAGRIRDAITTYSEGLARFPDSYLLYRHRGHRYITIRQYSRAMGDYEKAVALIEGLPVGAPEEGSEGQSASVSSDLAFDIFYHYGLAAYLSRDFETAESLYRKCHELANGDAMVVSIANWLYITLMRNGKVNEAAQVLAPLDPGMEAGGEAVYLERALMFRGDVSEAEYAKEGGGGAVRDYGLALVNLWRGDESAAKSYLEDAMGGGGWMGFANMAVEADLADIAKGHPDRTSVGALMDSWVLSWNTYDLDLAGALFVPGPKATYFSSEKAGGIQGYDALMEHHEGFGFVAGGKSADARLWLEEVWTEEKGDMAYVAARWLFDRDVAANGPVQQGPVTFVLLQGADGWRIAHAHFANDPPPI